MLDRSHELRMPSDQVQSRHRVLARHIWQAASISVEPALLTRHALAYLSRRCSQMYATGANGSAYVDCSLYLLNTAGAAAHTALAAAEVSTSWNNNRRTTSARSLPRVSSMACCSAHDRESIPKLVEIQ